MQSRISISFHTGLYSRYFLFWSNERYMIPLCTVLPDLSAILACWPKCNYWSKIFSVLIVCQSLASLSLSPCKNLSLSQSLTSSLSSSLICTFQQITSLSQTKIPREREERDENGLRIGRERRNKKGKTKWQSKPSWRRRRRTRQPATSFAFDTVWWRERVKAKMLHAK